MAVAPRLLFLLLCAAFLYHSGTAGSETQLGNGAWPERAKKEKTK